MKKILLFVMFLTLNTIASAQGGRVDEIASTITTVGGVSNVNIILPGATVRVCTFGASNVPCTPMAQLCTDITCSDLSGTNPITADAVGNFGFYALPGKYTYQVSYQTVLTGTFDVVVAPDTSGNTKVTGKWQFDDRPRLTLGLDYSPVTFANLGPVSNGRAVYCSDCLRVDPCTAGGNGAIAVSLNNAWSCAGGTGGGGGGDVFQQPAGNQNIVQPANTDFTANTFSGTTYVVPDFRWLQSPASPASLAIGTNTVTLSPCPKGVAGATADYYVYVSGTGTPEAAKVTGGTCTSGATSGTLIFDMVGTHAAGYTVGTASGGLREASVFAAKAVTNPSGSTQNGKVVVPPNYQMPVYAKTYIQASNQTVDFTGSIVECNVPNNASCLMVGNDTNANSFENITLVNPRMRAMVASTGAAIEVNANHTKIYNITTRNAFSGGYFGSLLQVDDDQQFRLDGMDSGLGTWAKCDATFCSTAITAPGPFNTWSAVGSLTHLNISAQCAYNGVDWESGNTLHISDSVIQGNPQFSIITGTPRGGFGPSLFTNVYSEVGSCSNPLYVAAGLASGAPSRAVAGLMLYGSRASFYGGEFPSGSIPTFACSGSLGAAQFNYWLVVHDSVLGVSTPLYFGKTASNCSGTLTGAYPRVTGTNTVVYDILRTTGSGNALIAPYQGNCGGGSTTACGSIATGVAQGGSGIITFTDDVSVNTTSYTVPVVTYKPKLPLWPGNAVLSGTADGQTDGSLSAALIVDDSSTLSPVISTTGNTQPSVFSNRCGVGQNGGALVSCIQGDPVGNNNAPEIGTLLQTGTIGGGPAAENGLKGRLNIYRSKNSSLPIGASIITLFDCNPAKTAASPNHRPTMDTCDVFLGNDNTTSGALSAAAFAIGAPTTVSTYINSLPDGSSWITRVSTDGFTLKGITQGTLSGSAANGTQIYCTDCKQGTEPCAASGNGAFAKRINGAWSCTGSGRSDTPDLRATLGQFVLVQTDANGTLQTLGGPTAATLGTGANVVPTGTVPGHRTYTSAASASVNTTAGVEVNAGAGAGASAYSFGTTKKYYAKMMLNNTTNARYWIGVGDLGTSDFTGPSAVFASDTPNRNYCMFRYSDVTDTTIKAACATDNTHQTLVDTGVAVDTTKPHNFGIVNNTSSVLFYIDGVLVGTVSTNIPAATTRIVPMWCSDNKNNATAVGAGMPYMGINIAD